MTVDDRATARVRALLQFSGRHRVLHLTWLAFFLSFVVWFNFAPFASTIGEAFDLSSEQLTVLALCNVALTVPARVLVGMALDRWGPRRVYAAILLYAAVPCLLFAAATSFGMLVASRLALSVVGAGFVVGIRMVAEWFPPREVGTAEGVYGGWGNFGSAAAALTLPSVAAIIGGADGWRWAIAMTGVLAACYGAYYLRAVADTPDGQTFTRPTRQGALEVTSPAAVTGLIVLNVPLLAVLGLVAWRLQHVGFLSSTAFALTVVVLVVLLAVQSRAILSVNRPARADIYPPEDRYPFRSVVVLCLAYFVTFGSELAVVSMLPLFFASTFDLSPVVAGATASAFAFMNLLARPTGGLLSDLLGSRRRTLGTLLVGLSVGYVGMSLIGPSWPVPLAMVAAMACSFFVQAGEGATYAIVPLVKKRVSGQISGMVGAYGNVGALVFLTLLLFVGPTAFFVAIGASSVLASLACRRWLVEPAGSFAEVHSDTITIDAAVPEPAAQPA
jgi:MFS transporter, NNP family, nitrate/nitrite transporter